jgi:hypothetical protein
MEYFRLNHDISRVSYIGGHNTESRIEGVWYPAQDILNLPRTFIMFRRPLLNLDYKS